jgi:hypothetical protein
MTKKKQQSRHMLSRQQNAKSRLNHRQRRNDSRQAGGRSELPVQLADKGSHETKDVTKKNTKWNASLTKKDKLRVKTMEMKIAEREDCICTFGIFEKFSRQQSRAEQKPSKARFG